MLPCEEARSEFYANILLMNRISVVWLEFNTKLGALKKNILSFNVADFI